MTADLNGEGLEKHAGTHQQCGVGFLTLSGQYSDGGFKLSIDCLSPGSPVTRSSFGCQGKRVEDQRLWDTAFMSVLSVRGFLLSIFSQTSNMLSTAYSHLYKKALECLVF